jgi:hypothetical protein
VSAALELVDVWIDAVNARDVERLVGMYAPQARLLATFSPHFLMGETAIRGYFEALASRPNVSVELHRHSLESMTLRDTFWGASGLYSFRFEIDGDLLTFPSRFTFTFDASQAAPILHHHSSQVPRSLG